MWFTSKRAIENFRGLQFYWNDFTRYGLSMNWKTKDRDYKKISSELIYQYHKIEKGLCLPPPRRFFGLIAINETLRLLAEWRSAGLPSTHPIYRAALDVLAAYRVRLDTTPPPPDVANELIPRLNKVLQDFDPEHAIQTPYIASTPPSDASAILHEIALARRSIRSFSDAPVDFVKVEKSVEIAMLSPSACNRQPWRIHFYDDKDQIGEMLRLQNGNSGFGHTVPLLAVIAGDTTSFFGVEERIQPVLDAGLFLSTFLLALEANGLSSCCLNWCASIENDRKAHTLGNIPDNHQIMTFLAIGIRSADSLVARSHRRPIQDCVIKH